MKYQCNKCSSVIEMESSKFCTQCGESLYKKTPIWKTLLYLVGWFGIWFIISKFW